MQQFIFFFLVTVAADQLTKLLSSWLGWQVYINSGISFALLGNESQVALIILSFILIVLLGLRYGYFWAKHPLVAGLFFGGAFSNVVDRLLFDGVRDWIPLPFISIHNNLADIAVVVSVLCMIWFFQKDENE